MGRVVGNCVNTRVGPGVGNSVGNGQEGVVDGAALGVLDNEGLAVGRNDGLGLLVGQADGAWLGITAVGVCVNAGLSSVSSPLLEFRRLVINKVDPMATDTTSARIPAITNSLFQFLCCAPSKES